MFFFISLHFVIILYYNRKETEMHKNNINKRDICQSMVGSLSMGWIARQARIMHDLGFQLVYFVLKPCRETTSIHMGG
jgi:uncharacterized membrane protein